MTNICYCSEKNNKMYAQRVILCQINSCRGRSRVGVCIINSDGMLWAFRHQVLENLVNQTVYLFLQSP